MAFTKSFPQMQDEINDIFIQHNSGTRVEKVYNMGKSDSRCILVRLDHDVGLSELEDISILTGDDDIWVDTFNYKIELTIIPDKWIDDSKN